MRFIKDIPKQINKMSHFTISFYKFGLSIVILALAGIYFLCEEDALNGSVGLEIYYAPMLDYILTTLCIFWAGTLLIDLTEKEITAGKSNRR